MVSEHKKTLKEDCILNKRGTRYIYIEDKEGIWVNKGNYPVNQILMT